MQGSDPHRVLARNAACHQCRRRKLKCDAQRPTCGNCRKPRQRGPIKFEPPEPCTWDEMRDPSVRTLRKRELKERKNSLNHADSSYGTGSSGEWSSSGSHQQSLHPYGNGHMPPAAPGSNPSDQRMSTTPASSTPAGSGLVSWAGSVPAPAPPPPQPIVHPGQPPQPEHVGAQVLTASPGVVPGMGAGGDMVWPEWPRDLPSPAVLEHIVHVFFDRVPVLPKMLHRATFLSNLRLPPLHPNFPVVALLHAILAQTSSYLPPESISSRDYFPVGTPSHVTVHPEYDHLPRTSSGPTSMLSFNIYPIGDGMPHHNFQTWHRQKCFERLSEAIAAGLGLFQAAQAMAIITALDQSNGWFAELWLDSAMAVRLAIPLNICLNTGNIENTQIHHPAKLMAPAQTNVEQAERTRTWWVIYICERSVVGGTIWPTSIADDDITVELPVPQSTFDRGLDGLVGVQTLQSPDLITHHPPEHVDSLSLLVKALKLYTDTAKFLRRYSRGSHSYQRYLSDPGLRKCLADINTFRVNFPAHMRRAIQRTEGGNDTIDPELFLAISLTHSAVLNLGEPLITDMTWSDDAAKMILSAVRAILSLIYDISATSYDLSLLPAEISGQWLLAARCLVRFGSAARLSNDEVSVAVFDAELQVLRIALEQLGARHPVGLKHLGMLEKFMGETAEGLGRTLRLNCSTEEVFNTELGRTIRNQSKSSRTSFSSTSTFMPPNGRSSASMGSPAGRTNDSSSVSPRAGGAPTPSANFLAAHPHYAAATQAAVHMGGSIQSAPVPIPQQQGGMPGAPAGPYAVEYDTSGLPSPSWFKTYDGFVSSFAFDPLAMAATINPQATFDGSGIGNGMAVGGAGGRGGGF